MTAPETGTGGTGNAAGAAGTGGDGEAGTTGNGGGTGGTGGTMALIEPPDLIAFWRFNEGMGATVLDSSGFGQTLTISTSSRWTQAGHEGAAFAFDGASDVAAFTPQEGQRLFDYPTIPLTFSAWVKPTAVAASRPFATAVARSHEDYAFQDFWLGLVDGRPSCTIHASDQDGPVAGAVLTANAWTHIACTYRADGLIKLFVNGAYAASGSSNQNLGPIPTAILVGASETMTPPRRDQHFPGAIDDVRIYNRTLTDAEVLSIAR